MRTILHYAAVAWLGTAAGMGPVEVSKADSPPAPSGKIVVRATDSKYLHKIGKAYGVSKTDTSEGSWGAGVSDGAGFLSYGPYLKWAAIGTLTVTFGLSIDNNSAGDDVVGSVDVFDSGTGAELARHTIARTDFAHRGQQEEFDIEVELRKPATLEFRVHSEGKAEIHHFSTTVSPDVVTMEQFWDGKAHFEPLRQTKFKSTIKRFSNWQTADPATGADGATASVVAMDGNWYAFNRYVIKTPKGVCNGNLLATVIRSSRDHGQTWSDPVPVAVPAGCDRADSSGACMGPSSAPDACVVTDGSAIFDGATDTWHLLSQCLSTAGGWNLCHYVRAGRSPMGRFVADQANPVVKGNDLFRRICAGAGKHCDPRTRDEGTPQILEKRDGYFYVTFHGALPEREGIHGARGVARTRDFHVWETSGDDLPGDAMLSAVDCNRWHVKWNEGGCIGTGAASTLRSAGTYYTLAEGADKSLACTPGQNWDFGLFRNKSIGASGSWLSYSENPLIINSNVAPSGCALQYMNLFRDRGEIFLMFVGFSPGGPLTNMYELLAGEGKKVIVVR